ncbi:hypothetical protein PPL_09658 [Heterostelium album PN500]|uniref:Tetratricopeptide repeat protein n=1 Tax=Heterostelium pallidum (strain ATCC 26659 / Pp 5 / PN500) TaxID=670386 RepID=D3BNY7_HETP5|nr:hypothetical protein PPL_09658 [Heterostelium album PN500]EFA76906.1 hypothetical protein PPL_09658 [Heterostelium album PN500]|eukprot:XP_020429038.1 hypothetical protein PPL_09658 [Heterostelium album PN500]
MDLKQSLKDARDAIDKKDYKKALEICTDSLDYHNNFNIHLFMGLSLFNLNRYPESEKSYQNALSLTPASPFPLRGLMDVYTKSGENDKLLKIVEQLIPLTTDESKKRDLQVKGVGTIESGGRGEADGRNKDEGKVNSNSESGKATCHRCAETYRSTKTRGDCH